MKKTFDISEFVNTKTVNSTLREISEAMVLTRKSLKITQKALAERSGVSYASIRRFENSGEISLTSLLKIAEVLDCLEDFSQVFKHPKVLSLKDYKA